MQWAITLFLIAVALALLGLPFLVGLSESLGYGFVILGFIFLMIALFGGRGSPLEP